VSELTAIDILVNPDDSTIEQARTWNARMRESVTDGFVLDATHQPHITTLQRYVRTAELDQVYSAIEQNLADTDTGSSTSTTDSTISDNCPASSWMQAHRTTSICTGDIGYSVTT